MFLQHLPTSLPPYVSLKYALKVVLVSGKLSRFTILFPSRCTLRTTNRQQWDILSISKRRILDFVDNIDADASQGGLASYNSNARLGVRLAAIKFAQRMILVQTRLVQDPRVRPNSRHRAWNHY